METEVMMLGGLGQARAGRVVGPRWTRSVLPPPKTTPQEPQNLLRQTVMNGLSGTPWYASWIPRPPLPPTPPYAALGQLEVDLPEVTPGQLVSPPITPAAGTVAARTPGLGPGAFRTPGLGPTRVALFGLGKGINRTVAIGLGQIQGQGPAPQAWQDVDQALLSYDVQRGATTPPSPGVTQLPLPGQGRGGDIPMLDVPVSNARVDARHADVISLGQANGAIAPANGAAAPAAGAEAGVTMNGDYVGLGITWATVATVSSLASVYHGYRRNTPKGAGPALGWGLWWGLMGAMFPLVTPVVGVAQGWAKPKRGR